MARSSASFSLSLEERILVMGVQLIMAVEITLQLKVSLSTTLSVTWVFSGVKTVILPALKNVRVSESISLSPTNMHTQCLPLLSRKHLYLSVISRLSFPHKFLLFLLALLATDLWFSRQNIPEFFDIWQYKVHLLSLIWQKGRLGPQKDRAMKTELLCLVASITLSTSFRFYIQRKGKKWCEIILHQILFEPTYH